MRSNNDTYQSFKVQQWITVVGALLMVVKFVAYYLTNSVAILTDALESIVNVTAGVVSLYSLYIASKPRDTNHPYGHGKAEFLSAGVEGTLIIIAGLMILVEAIRKLLHPVPLHQINTGILLIAISGAVNYIAGLVAENTGKKYKSIAITATGKHLKSDAYSTLGLIIGLLVLTFSKITWIDSVVALIFGVIIIVTGFNITRKSVAGIMDEADESLLKEMVTVINAHRRENWVDLHNFRIIQYGNTLHVDCHLTLPWYLNVDEAHHEVEALGNIIAAEFGDSLELFTHTDGCQPYSCRLCTVSGCEHRQQKFERQLTWTMSNIFENKKHTLETV
ncbi:MAG TPA: cation diffusion facilitator family transporter [Phnomibacter sp.]|nr:cation diffusion facilitator family transporter [Phnomibacter sp.]